MSLVDARSIRQSLRSAPPQPDTKLQTILLMFGYGFSAIVLCSAVANPVAVIAAGLGAVLGVLLYRWHVDQDLRNVVPALIGFGMLLTGLILPAWLGRWWFVPYVAGISTTMVLVQSITMAMLAAGIVLVARSLSKSTRVLSMTDGLVIVAAICLRFASHRNYHWGNPRFLADWAGIQGYELPMLFALLGLGALLVGLVSGMVQTSRRHAATSVLSVLLFFIMLVWLGGKFLRHPTPEIVEVTGSPKVMSASGGSGGEANSEGSSSNEANSGDSGAETSGEATSAQEDTGAKQGSGASSSTASTGEDRASSTAASAGSSGKSDSDLPSASSLRSSPEPIAVVLLEDDIQPIEKVWYFRQTALSLFNGMRLVTASDERYDNDIPSGFSEEEVFIGGIPLPENMHQLVPLTVNLIIEQPRPFSLPSMIAFAPLTNPDPQFFRQSYHATSCVLTDEVVDDETYSLYSSLCYLTKGNSNWDDDLFEHYTRTPDDPRFQELAETIIAERITAVANEELDDSAMLKALSIKRWLEQNTTYSFDPKFDDPAVNPAEQFLFGERHGYCVHIAHASVYLMRSLGIPSRIGVGYAVPTERSGKSSSILIQTSDAHAWPEIYLDGAGWVVVDASPEKIDESTQFAPEPDKTLSQFLADKARNKDEHQKHIQKTKYSRGFPLRLSHIPWVLLVGIALPYCVKLWIHWSPRFADNQELIRVTQRATILQLAEIGVQRHIGETRTEFACRVAAIYPEFAKLTECHVRQTYGRGYRLARETCLDVQKRTRRRSAHASSLLRRMIGRLDPRFWVLVR